jgi:hypothetical protein
MSRKLRPARQSASRFHSSNCSQDDWLAGGKDLQASRPEIRWFWLITVMGPARFRVRTGNRAPTLEQAKADFQAAWEAFKAANVNN